MIIEKEPDLVGFSAQCTTYPSVIQIARILKERKSHIKIIAGGHNASFLDVETMESFPYFDSFIRGEGEISFREIVQSYEGGEYGEGVSGVTYRKGGEVIRNRDRDLIHELDSLKIPDYSLVPSFSVYKEACGLPRSIAILEVGRGCPHNCIYCSESIMWRRKCRTFSVPRLISEMKNLAENFHAECFLLAYDQFTSDRNFVELFCESVIRERLNHLPWYCISRLDSVDASLLKLMKEAGCESMCYGIDSGSKRTLAFIRKRIDKEILYRRVRETADQGLIPTLSFVIGFPEEEKNDIDQTLDLALMSGILGNNNPLIQMPTVLPGTDLHKKYGDNLVRLVDTYFALGLEFDGGQRLASDEELINSDPFIFSSFYNLPCRGLSIEELNIISSYFSLIVQFFPKSFFLICREVEESASELFLKCFNWINLRLKRPKFFITPQDIFRYFTDFARGTLEKKSSISMPYIHDILRYEKTALSAARFSHEKPTFSTDFNNIEKLRPLKNRKALLRRFDFELSVIIMHIKEGNLRKHYDRKESYMVFFQDDDILDVSEINRFTHDFLELCDGKNSLLKICESLFFRYGEGDKGAFFNSCIESVHVLGKLGLLSTEKV
jgi:radical SAM superfamily enzyme YgiQ (UPF0313 family)